MILQTVISELQTNFFDKTILGEKIADYCWFAGIILFTLLLKRTTTNLLAGSGNIIARFFSPQQADKKRLGIMIRQPLGRVVQTVLYFLAFDQLDELWSRYTIRPFLGKKSMPIPLDKIIDHIFLFFFIIFLGQLLSRIVDFVVHMQVEKARKENDKERVQLLPLMKEIGKLLMWTACLFWILGSVFHVNVPALITGLGIGGIAIALAAKESVENFFAAMTILSDKPFEVGDVIRLGEIEGNVERIGFRSTRLRNSDGSAYIIPNQKLVSENLINLSRRDTRVIKLNVNIRYGIEKGDLEKIIADVKKMLPSINYVKEPVDVVVDKFSRETLQLQISYCLPHPLTKESTVDKIKQEVNMRIYNIVNKYAAFYISPLNENKDEETKGAE